MNPSKMALARGFEPMRVNGGAAALGALDVTSAHSKDAQMADHF
jgi:hypothetical protein